MALPYLFHQNSRYGRFAYDDFSEYDSDREVESAQQQQMVSLLYSFLWKIFRKCFCVCFGKQDKCFLFVEYVLCWCWSWSYREMKQKQGDGNVGNCILCNFL